MAEWVGCKEEKCKLWDDGFCMLSDGNYEYCKRTGESYYPKTSKLISEEIIKILEGKSAIEWNEGYHAYVEDLKDLLDNEDETTLKTACPACQVMPEKIASPDHEGYDRVSCVNSKCIIEISTPDYPCIFNEFGAEEAWESAFGPKQPEGDLADLRFIPVPAQDKAFEDILDSMCNRLNERMAEQPTNEKCRFCESTETYRTFCLSDADGIDPTIHIICEPICFNCIKKRVTKGEPI